MNQIVRVPQLASKFLALLPAQTPAAATKPSPVSGSIGPQAFALLAEAKKHNLWDGIWDYTGKLVEQPYPSQSEADYALLGSIIRDAVLMGVAQNDAASHAIWVFEQSGLYRAAKRNRVLTQDLPRLIASHYTTPATLVVAQVQARKRLLSGTISFSNTPPPPRDYVLEDLILHKKVYVLAGLGGVSKTMWSMMLAVHIALGRDFLGKVTKPGSVLMILGEEDQEEINRRFNAITHYLNLTPAEIVLVHERVRAYPLHGLDARLTASKMGTLEKTDFSAEIITAAGDLVSASGIPLGMLALDHAGLIHGGEFNSREEVVQTMREVGLLSNDLGVAVLVLAHSPKAARGKDVSDAGDVAGSTAWSDLARGVFILRAMTELEGKNFGIPSVTTGEYVSLNIVKNNYGPTGQQVWMVKSTLSAYGVSVLLHVNLSKPQSGNKSAMLNQKIKVFIAQHTGQYSKTALRDKQGGKSKAFGASKADVASAIEEMLQTGELRLVPPSQSQRAQYGLRAQITRVLEARP